MAATLAYHVALSPDDNDTIMVTSEDLPEVTTYGDDVEDALLRAQDAICAALAYRMDHREDIPMPKTGQGPLVEVPTEVALKVRVYQMLRNSGIKRAELARRLHQHGPQVDRLFNLRHVSKVEQLDAALRAVGQRIVFDIEPLDDDRAA
jgi:antitoxin HicB